LSSAPTAPPGAVTTAIDGPTVARRQVTRERIALERQKEETVTKIVLSRIEDRIAVCVRH
jgi:hypothetical protein